MNRVTIEGRLFFRKRLRRATCLILAVFLLKKCRSRQCLFFWDKTLLIEEFFFVSAIGLFRQYIFPFSSKYSELSFFFYFLENFLVYLDTVKWYSFSCKFRFNSGDEYLFWSAYSYVFCRYLFKILQYKWYWQTCLSAVGARTCYVVLTSNYLYHLTNCSYFMYDLLQTGLQCLEKTWFSSSAEFLLICLFCPNKDDWNWNVTWPSSYYNTLSRQKLLKLKTTNIL